MQSNYPWPFVPLKEIASDVLNSFVDGPFGSNLKTDEYTDEGVRLIQLQNIGDGAWIDENKKFTSERKFQELKRHSALPEDIVIAKMADPIARACIIPPVSERFLVVADCIKLTVDKKKYNSKFIVYAINHNIVRNQAEIKSTGTTRQRINLSTLKTVEVLAPPISEQHRIAEILDTIDEAIQKTEALIAKLKAMKQGLLHDLLTRGLDENGKLRDPKAHPDQFKGSPLGSIPKEWDVWELNDVAEKIQDGTHFSPQTTKGPFRYLTSKNIRFGEVDLSECGWISKKEHENIYSRCDVKYGDVLLTKDGANTGNAAINSLNEPVSLLSSIAFIRCGNEKLHSEYVLHYILSPNSQQRIKDLMSGNAITRLTLTIIKSFKILVPGYEEQCRIIEPLNLYDARIRAEEKYRDKLKLQKKGLMHDLLTGKVRVKV